MEPAWTDTGEVTLDLLRRGPCYSFADWPVSEVPRIAAGVYTVWRGPELVYAGMSGQGGGAGRDAVEAAKKRGRTWGLRTRLASHASGRRSGDQFCVYVGDMFVLPELRRSQVEAIRDRTINLDDLIRDFIRNELTFRFAETSSGNEALELERLIKAGVLGQQPRLNPS